MRLLLGQVSPVIGDVEGNLARCHAAIQAGRRAGARVVVLPELVLSGYPPRDLLEREDLIEACHRAAEALATESSDDLVVVFGTPWRDEAGLRNAAIVAEGGRIAQVVFKTLLPTYDVFDEHRYFIAETRPAPVRVGGLTLGVTVCEDIWYGTPGGGLRVEGASSHYPLDPVDHLHGCDLVLNVSASPFHAGKGSERLALVQRQARRLGAPLVYCNAVGGNDELIFDGDSLVVDAQGQLLAQGAAFAEEHLVVDLDQDPIVHRALPFEDEVILALQTGIHDYLQRCGFRDVVLGLSGGIDSAVVAALAARAIGPEHVLTIGMPGPFSSQGSIDDARALAHNLGTRFELIGIGDIHQAYLTALAPVIGHLPTDVTEENLQARARGNLLMALSNKLGNMLLTTGNKSEMAVGYATLYGDMSGGLAVIADLFKTDVYRVARAFNRESEVIPAAIIDKPPSAELAPDQKDEDSLPPYPVLDAILRRYVEGTVSPAQIIAEGHDPAIVQRVVRMVVRAEYKRWQAPPALRVSHKAFGTGRRIPLAQRWHLS